MIKVDKHRLIRALRDSIVKWEMLEGFALGEAPMPCPLCQEYRQGIGECVGCPLYEVGTPHCGERSDTSKAIAKLLKRLRAELEKAKAGIKGD